MPTLDTMPPALSDAQRAALDMLMSRHSPWPLTEPAPSAPELDLVFQAALRAPDHGQLRPWRFIVIRGDARHALAKVFARAARARDPDGNAERFASKALSAPVLIALGVRIVHGHKVPASEQVLAVGAGVMNMLNALHVLGYGGFWASGLNSRDPLVRRELGLDAGDELIGFLYVGTPKDRSDRGAARPDPDACVSEWTGPAAP